MDTPEVCPRWLSIPQTARLQSHKQGGISINTTGADCSLSSSNKSCSSFFLWSAFAVRTLLLQAPGL
ncbi:hypothetical protein KOW79_013324 [Hemibagrus wyckioides]|uniref:Uncharacterized protein n=1 Tax=Hemibagrus wyckioides TaxID=337641 RepID=A0A9D3NJX6_9TELE|nr:hypothetical protein KOW79_013324 [Hemibagrus wyckioides]